MTEAVQDNINETTTEIQGKKQNIWQLAIQQKYIDSQKSAVNVYVVSATGNSMNVVTGSQTNNVINEGLTNRYMSLIERELGRKYSDISKTVSPVYSLIPTDLYIRSAPDTMSEMVNQQMINQYNSAQHLGRSSLLDLRV